MKCPFCGYDDSKVLDTRPTDEGYTIRRRRECLKCQKRFTTYEKIEQSPVMVIKKDGNRQAFDRDKIVRGMIKSCEKRPVSADEIEEAVNNIEKKIENSMRREITSLEIGEMVMDELKDLDEVSYVRFASVYKEFKDVDQLLESMQGILSDNKRSDK